MTDLELALFAVANNAQRLIGLVDKPNEYITCCEECGVGSTPEWAALTESLRALHKTMNPGIVIADPPHIRISDMRFDAA